MQKREALIGGLTFTVSGHEFPSEGEERLLEKVASQPVFYGAEPWPHGETKVRVEATRQTDWPRDEDRTDVGAVGARVVTRGETVHVGHPLFTIEIPPPPQAVRFWRGHRDGIALDTALRLAISSRLPHHDGLTLHSAGIAFPEGGVAFFGVSGAGKSTISQLSPFPVLSEEMVVVKKRADGRFYLSSCGYWSPGYGGRGPNGWAPLRALVKLEKGPGFSAGLLSEREARLELIKVLMVPRCPSIWSRAIAVLAELTKAVPVYRMGWKAPEPPFEEFRRRFL